MASIAFDTLQYARRLKSAGVPEEQAEVQAELMGETFGYYVNDLVTRDYLDATLDARFSEQYRYVDQRFAEQDGRIDQHFTEQDRRIDQRFSEQDARFAKLESRLNLHGWMLAVIMAATVIPALSRLI